MPQGLTVLVQAARNVVLVPLYPVVRSVAAALSATGSAVADVSASVVRASHLRLQGWGFSETVTSSMLRIRGLTLGSAGAVTAAVRHLRRRLFSVELSLSPVVSALVVRGKAFLSLSTSGAASTTTTTIPRRRKVRAFALGTSSLTIVTRPEATFEMADGSAITDADGSIVTILPVVDWATRRRIIRPDPAGTATVATSHMRRVRGTVIRLTNWGTAALVSVRRRGIAPSATPTPNYVLRPTRRRGAASLSSSGFTTPTFTSTRRKRRTPTLRMFGSSTAAVQLKKPALLTDSSGSDITDASGVEILTYH